MRPSVLEHPDPLRILKESGLCLFPVPLGIHTGHTVPAEGPSGIPPSLPRLVILRKPKGEFLGRELPMAFDAGFHPHLMCSTAPGYARARHRRPGREDHGQHDRLHGRPMLVERLPPIRRAAAFVGFRTFNSKNVPAPALLVLPPRVPAIRTIGARHASLIYTSPRDPPAAQNTSSPFPGAAVTFRRRPFLKYRSTTFTKGVLGLISSLSNLLQFGHFAGSFLTCPFWQ